MRKIAKPPPAVVTRYGTVAYFSDDDPIGKSLVMYGEWAAAEIGLLCRLISLNDVVVDVGAFIGTHALAFSRQVGPDGLVLAFEPQPPAFELLRHNLTTNGCVNVRAAPTGLGRAAGQKHLPKIDYAAHANIGAARLVDGEPGAPGCPVPIGALDDLQLSRCRLVKLDAEGMGGEILVGMADTIRRCRPIIFAECNTIDEGVDIWNEVGSKGYRLFLVRSSAYNPANFAGNSNNAFGVAQETALLAMPHEIEGSACSDTPLVQIVPLENMHRLGEVLLATPRFGDATTHDRDPEALRASIKELELRDADDRKMAEYRAALVARQSQWISELRKAAESHADELARIEFGAARLSAQLQAMYGSSSWCLTAPLRWISASSRRYLRHSGGWLDGLAGWDWRRIRTAQLAPAEAHSRVPHEDRGRESQSDSRDYIETRTPIAPTLEEWESLSLAWNPRDTKPVVDIIVPVYGGFNETMRSLFSVLSAWNEVSYSLIVIDDCSPDQGIREGIGRLACRGLVELHRTPENLGYVGACNLGLGLHPERDIVLLNSDTEVFGNWIDRLRAAALRDRRTATVTPFTSNGEICSYPKFVMDNHEPLEMGDAALDELAASVNAGREVEIPTGVGFCMYIRRACLDAIGFFDVASFGRGYGEENDLCRRAVAAGWRNILAPDVFVRHYGGASFGSTKAGRIREAIRTVERLHPGYVENIGAFIRADPVRPYREALDAGRLSRRAQDRAMLFVAHNLGGGTERHTRELADLLEAEGVPVFFCRPDSHDPEMVRFEDPRTPGLPNIPAFSVARDLEHFIDWLARIGIRHVHVHHLAGFPEQMSEFVCAACSALGIRYDATLHDYMTLCPRINFVDAAGYYCGEPDIESCEGCIKRDGSPFGRPRVSLWRQQYARFLAGARTVFVPDEDVKRRLGRYMPDLDVTVRPHPDRRVGASFGSDRVASMLPVVGERRPQTRRIVILGAVGLNKGSQLLLETASAARARHLPLEFVLIGYTDRDEQLQALDNVVITGRYDEADAPALVTAANADIAWFPAVCPETYSYTLSIAFDARVYPVAFDFGAIANRIRAVGWGELLPIPMMLDPGAVASRLWTIRVPPIRAEAAEDMAKRAHYPNVLETYYGAPA